MEPLREVEEIAREIFNKVSGDKYQESHGCVWSCTEAEFLERLITEALLAERKRAEEAEKGRDYLSDTLLDYGTKLSSLEHQLEEAKKELSLIKDGLMDRVAEQGDVRKCGHFVRRIMSFCETCSMKSELEHQVRVMSDVVREQGRCTQCGGTGKTHMTQDGISKWNTPCWRCHEASGLMKWAVDALTPSSSQTEKL